MCITYIVIAVLIDLSNSTIYDGLNSQTDDMKLVAEICHQIAAYIATIIVLLHLRSLNVETIKLAYKIHEIQT